MRIYANVYAILIANRLSILYYENNINNNTNNKNNQKNNIFRKKEFKFENKILKISLNIDFMRIP